MQDKSRISVIDQNFSPPIIIGHRGSPGTHPENTMISLQHALDVGVDFIEFDLHLTKDGHVVVMHDHTVDRTTDGTGKVKDFTLAEIKKLDAGYNFTTDGGKTYPYRGKGIQVPTLDEVLDAFPDAAVMLEIKDGCQSLVEQAFDAIIKQGREDKTIFGSESYFVNRRARKYLKEHDIDLFVVASKYEAMAALLAYKYSRLPFLLKAFSAVAVPVDIEGKSLLSKEFNKFAHDHDLMVAVWSPEDATLESEAAMMEDYFDMGLDVMVTNFPEQAVKIADAYRKKKNGPAP